MVSLPTTTPNSEEATTYYTLIQDKFQIALNSDKTIWEAWTTAVEDTNTYKVSETATANAAKFSEYILNWRCNSTA